MSTFETLIVFAALMGLLALVSIGIDWIGKPLKHRRFIPRIYRFDDEKLPTDEFGNPTLDYQVPATPVFMPMAPPSYPLPTAPAHAATSPPVPAAPVEPVPVEPVPAAPVELVPVEAPDQAAPLQPAPTVVATLPESYGKSAGDPPSQRVPSESGSAFSDLLSGGDEGPDSGPVAATEWMPDMTLDAPVNGERPSLALKAERYWSATAAAIEETHFDPDTVDRMRSGKAPRRRNPRSGRTESMRLTGLRRASQRGDVRMTWPDDSIDPWAAS